MKINIDQEALDYIKSKTNDNSIHIILKRVSSG